ncbi:DUF1761 domain-containing protein [Candidatus Saccharibacteria bacterium]|nr:DUF1761 domain-containing protein [Candidatus Saccharibacteria bacterium]
MGVDYMAVLVAAVVMFAIGALWYMVLFAKQWGEMFGFDKLSKKEQKEMRSKMGPMMVLQAIVTVMSAYALAKLIALAPDYSVYKMALVVWLGIMVPVTVSGVIFGGVEPKWVKRRILIMVSGSLVHTMAAAWVIGMIQK